MRNAKNVVPHLRARLAVAIRFTLEWELFEKNPQCLATLDFQPDPITRKLVPRAFGTVNKPFVFKGFRV